MSGLGSFIQGAFSGYEYGEKNKDRKTQRERDAENYEWTRESRKQQRTDWEGQNATNARNRAEQARLDAAAAEERSVLAAAGQSAIESFNSGQPAQEADPGRGVIENIIQVAQDDEAERAGEVVPYQPQQGQPPAQDMPPQRPMDEQGRQSQLAEVAATLGEDMRGYGPGMVDPRAFDAAQGQQGRSVMPATRPMPQERPADVPDAVVSDLLARPAPTDAQWNERIAAASAGQQGARFEPPAPPAQPQATGTDFRGNRTDRPQLAPTRAELIDAQLADQNLDPSLRRALETQRSALNAGRSVLDSAQRFNDTLPSPTNALGRLGAGAGNLVGDAVSVVSPEIGARIYDQFAGADEYYGTPTKTGDSAASTPAGSASASTPPVQDAAPAQPDQSPPQQAPTKNPHAETEALRVAATAPIEEGGSPAVQSAAATAPTTDSRGVVGANEMIKATQGQRDRAAKSFLDHYAETAVPQLIEFYASQGNIERAEAFETWAESREGRGSIEQYGRMIHAMTLNDTEGVLDHAASYINEVDLGYQVVRDESDFETDEQGNITGATITMVDTQTGRKFQNQYESQADIINMLTLSMSPEKLQEYMFNQLATAADIAAKALEHERKIDIEVIKSGSGQAERNTALIAAAKRHLSETQFSTWNTLSTAEQDAMALEFVRANQAAGAQLSQGAAPPPYRGD